MFSISVRTVLIMVCTFTIFIMPAVDVYAGDTYGTTTDPLSTLPPNLPWKIGDAALPGVGETKWIAFENRAADKLKEWSIDLPAGGVQDWDFQASGGPGESSTVLNPFIPPREVNGIMTLTFISRPQPAWDFVRLTRTAKGFNDNREDIGYAWIKCWKVTRCGHSLCCDEITHQIPTDIIRMTGIFIFPENVAIDTDTPPAFSADPSTGNWSYEYVFTDPDGEGHPLGGIHWFTDGNGITATDEYDISFTMVDDADSVYTYYAYEAEAGIYHYFASYAIELGPAVTIIPTSFDFGTVDEGTSGSDVMFICNAGGGNLNYNIEVSYDSPREIDGAYVEALDSYKPGMTMDIEFHAVNASSDAEWIDEIALEFPAGCDIIGSTNFDVIGQTRYLEYEGQTGDGAHVVYWNWDGGYGNMYSSDEALATVTIAFSAAKSGDISIPYTMSGDDWGDPPHDISGVLTISEADPTTSWLVCTPTSGSADGSGCDTVTVSYSTAGLPNDTYDADIVVDHNGGKSEDIIPATITVIGGDSKAKIAPDPAYIYMKYAFTPMDMTVFVGHFNDSTQGEVAGLELSEFWPDTSWVSATIVGVTTHPSFTGEVVEATFPAAPFLEFYGGPIGTVLKNFVVRGTFDDASTFTAKGKVSLHGKDAKTGGRTWMVPPDMVLFHGDANLDGYIDIDDAVTTIEIIFVGGQIFGPLTIADCDCSHSVDIDDVVYLVQYIFNEGPFPCQE